MSETGNMYWKDIKENDVVEDTGKSWIVHRGTERFLAYWDSRTAFAAQSFLRRRAIADAKRLHKVKE